MWPRSAGRLTVSRCSATASTWSTSSRYDWRILNMATLASAAEPSTRRRAAPGRDGAPCRRRRRRQGRESLGQRAGERSEDAVAAAGGDLVEPADQPGRQLL